MSRHEVLELIRRARTRLEALRLLQGAARGALLGGAAGLCVLLAMKALASWPVLPGVAWGLLLAGALSGLLHALLVGKAIDRAAAALFLDRRLHAGERFVTVLTCPDSAFVARVAHELEQTRDLPRLPVPREAAWVPAALFLVFAAGLLPAAGAPERSPRATTVALVPAGPGQDGASDALPPDVDAETLEKLAQGEPPAAAEAAALDEAIEHRVRRPEDRRAAHDALERARKGDTDAARTLARVLDPEPQEPDTRALVQATAYPEAAEFVREYRLALSKEKTK